MCDFVHGDALIELAGLVGARDQDFAFFGEGDAKGDIEEEVGFAEEDLVVRVGEAEGGFEEGQGDLCDFELAFCPGFIGAEVEDREPLVAAGHGDRGFEAALLWRRR